MGRPLLILLALLIVAVHAVSWNASSYPNPTTQAGAKKCGLKSAGMGLLNESNYTTF
jgi:hypothetical protein